VMSPVSILVSRHALIPVDNIIGAWLIGILVSCTVFGVTCLQVYLYYVKHCSRDSIFLKSFVATMIFIDTLNLALLCVSLYQAVVTNFGDYIALENAPWSLLAQIVVGFVLSNMVQIFYAYRIWLLSNKSLYIPVLIIIISLAETVMGIVFTKNAFTLSFQQESQNTPYSTSGFVFEVACDVLISFSMVYYLWHSRSGLTKTNRAINLLVIYIINSGVLMLIFAVCSLIMWTVSPNNLIYAPFFWVLLRVYGCSFMSMLNSREHVRQQLNGTDNAMITIPSSYTANHSTVVIRHGTTGNDFEGTFGDGDTANGKQSEQRSFAQEA